MTDDAGLLEDQNKSGGRGRHISPRGQSDWELALPCVTGALVNRRSSCRGAIGPFYAGGMA